MRRHGAYKGKSTSKQIAVGLNGYAQSGTWTLSSDASPNQGRAALARTANNNTTEYYLIDLRCLYDKLTGRSIKITSYKVHYTCDNSESGDDVQFHLVYRSLPADNSAPTVTAIAGDDDTDYDTSHNTAAKRVDSTTAPELHTATITVPTADQHFLDDGEAYSILTKVIEADDAGAPSALAIIIKDIVVTITQVL